MTDIKSTIKEIREKAEKGYTEKSLMKSHLDFFQQYPVIFRMAADSTFDFTHLDYMLDMKEKLYDMNKNNNAKVCEENTKQIDKVVYGTLMQEYMPENLMSEQEKN
jgi:hypothetical protein